MNEVVSTRVFPAPREAVFRAFSDPAVLARWWGPRGFTSTFSEFDLRPSGSWRFVMRSPDGTEHPQLNEFLEISAPRRIVFRHQDGAHSFRMEMTFDDEGGGTRLTWRMEFDTKEEADRVRMFILSANEQNFDRLHAQLSTTIRPFLMFQGNASEAIAFYLATIEDSRIVRIKRYGNEVPGAEGMVYQALISLAGHEVMVTDSPMKHGFTFTPSLSLYVTSTDGAKIERYFNALAKDGGVLMPLGEYPFSPKFGWVNDRFGVSWQLSVAEVP